MEQAIQKSIEEWGLIGIVVVGCIYLIRAIVSWMQKRMDEKDMQLNERHLELVKMSISVIDYVNSSKVVTQELVGEIQNMGKDVCGRIDSIGLKMEELNKKHDIDTNIPIK